MKAESVRNDCKWIIAMLAIVILKICLHSISFAQEEDNDLCLNYSNAEDVMSEVSSDISNWHDTSGDLTLYYENLMNKLNCVGVFSIEEGGLMNETLELIELNKHISEVDSKEGMILQKKIDIITSEILINALILGNINLETISGVRQDYSYRDKENDIQKLNITTGIDLNTYLCAQYKNDTVFYKECFFEHEEKLALEGQETTNDYLFRMPDEKKLYENKNMLDYLAYLPLVDACKDMFVNLYDIKSAINEYGSDYDTFGETGLDTMREMPFKMNPKTTNHYSVLDLWMIIEDVRRINKIDAACYVVE